jgi:hypothetical protein
MQRVTQVENESLTFLETSPDLSGYWLTAVASAQPGPLGLVTLPSGPFSCAAIAICSGTFRHLRCLTRTPRRCERQGWPSDSTRTLSDGLFMRVLQKWS